jgi:hypothetical protein
MVKLFCMAPNAKKKTQCFFFTIDTLKHEEFVKLMVIMWKIWTTRPSYP